MDTKEAIGKRPADLLRTVFPKPFEEIWEELLQTDRWEGELTHTKADGVQVIVASRWSLRRDQQGRPVAILETGNDITARKRWEEEIQASQPGACTTVHCARSQQQGAGSLCLFHIARPACALATWQVLPSFCARARPHLSTKKVSDT